MNNAFVLSKELEVIFVKFAFDVDTFVDTKLTIDAFADVRPEDRLSVLAEILVVEKFGVAIDPTVRFVRLALAICALEDVMLVVEIFDVLTLFDVMFVAFKLII